MIEMKYHIFLDHVTPLVPVLASYDMDNIDNNTIEFILVNMIKGRYDMALLVMKCH